MNGRKDGINRKSKTLENGSQSESQSKKVRRRQVTPPCRQTGWLSEGEVRVIRLGSAWEESTKYEVHEDTSYDTSSRVLTYFVPRPFLGRTGEGSMSTRYFGFSTTRHDKSDETIRQQDIHI